MSNASSTSQEDSSPTEGTSISDNQLIIIPQYPEALSSQGLFDNWLWNLDQIPQSIVMAPDYEAVTFFFKNFITLPQQAESTRGYLEFLVPLYNQALPSSVLHLATSAVAMAAVGQYPGREALVGEAVKSYGKAIRKLNTDLKDPVMSKSNETVLAILMFSLYEVSLPIHCNQPPSHCADHHVNRRHHNSVGQSCRRRRRPHKTPRYRPI